MPCLSIGCGKDVKPGWVRLDCDPESHPDILATIPPLPRPVLERRWDQIEAIHFIASLWAWEAREVLCQLWQVLEPGGKLILETPDIVFCMKHYLMSGANRLDNQNKYFEQFEEPISTTGSWEEHQLDLRGLYGNPAAHCKEESNKWGYTPRSLRKLLVEAGFDEKKIVELPAQTHVPIRDFRLEATK